MLRSSLPLLVLLSASAWADVRNQLDRFAEGLETLTGRFVQTTIDSEGQVKERTSGTLEYRSPDRFRWRYEDPFPQELVADGEQLWHYDEALEQVTVRPQPSAEESPMLVLTRPQLLDRFYRIEAESDPKVLAFRPLDADAMEFKGALLEFGNGQPVALELFDQLGQVTRLELFDLTRNAPVDPAVFEFVPPANVDLLEGY